MYLFVSTLCYSQNTFNNLLDFQGPNDIGISIVQNNDSTYFLVSQLINLSQRRAFIISKLDFGGDTIWSKLHKRDSSSIFAFNGSAFAKTVDSNLILVGKRQHLFVSEMAGFITKLNLLGDTIWHKEIKFNNNPVNEFYSVLANDDGTFIATGSTGPTSNADIWLVKFDASGNIMWEQTYGGGGHEKAFTIDNGIISGYIIAGRKDIGGGDLDAYLLKVSSTGIFEWDATFGNNEADLGHVIASENSLGYLVYGALRPQDNSNNEGFYKMLNADGSIRWEGECGYGIWSKDWFDTATELENGDYILAGSSYETDTINRPIGWVMKINGTNGDSLWSRRYTVRTSDHYFTDIIETEDKGLLLCGYVFSDDISNTQDAWLLKLDSMGCEVAGACTPTGLEEQMLKQVQHDWVLYPNPASFQFTIENSQLVTDDLRIINVLGEEVYRKSVSTYSTNIDISNWKNGVYFVRFNNKQAKLIVSH